MSSGADWFPPGPRALVRAMRFRTVVIAAALSATMAGTSGAIVRPRGGDAPTVYAAEGARLHRDTKFVRSVPRLAGWQAIWDRDTDVPLRLWGPGIATPNAVSDAAVAEAAARAFLAAHLDVLAPGAAITDFVVVANELDPSGELRAVGFEQRAGGLRVVGGAIGIGFKADKLFVVGSTALPHVAVVAPPVALARPALAATAQAWLGDDGFAVRPTVASLLGQPSERVIVPIVRPRRSNVDGRDPAGPAAPPNGGAGVIDVRFRLAEQLPVEELAGPGRWDVWLDAGSGAAIARQTRISYATGSVLFDVPDQSPSGARSPHPAPFATHNVDGAAVTADAAGAITWAGANPATVLPGLSGPTVKIKNVSGSLVADSLTLAPNGTVTWSKASDPLSDAQLDSYVYANVAKAFAKARLNPTLAWLDTQLSVSVNETMTCNAYSTGNDIHFFVADAQCENTGRIRDVVFHEFGHSVHNNSIIPGVGQFDGSLSEGLADTMAVSITGDHGVGRGFFFNDMALRDLDPVGIEKRWPQDADGEVHDEGEIIGEALWDLRTALVAKLGDTAGYTQLLKIYYGVMQRSADIPSTYAEALATDDDDGDLTNGTPNLCEINAAFGAHGLADPAFTLALTTPVRESYQIHFDAATSTVSSACPNATHVAGAKVDYHMHNAATGSSVDFAVAGTTWSAAIPTQPDGTLVDYRVTITLTDGSTMSYPDNKADPDYQFFVGPVTKLWCTDFESGAADWTHSGSPANRDEWQAGAPMGLGGDPKTAHGGTGVFGTDLSTDGMYKANGSSYAEAPAVDTTGYTNVHLQYYRWLTVEDGVFDKATISANGAPVWTNLTSAATATTTINHVDKEWRFSDVDLSAQAASGKVTLRFALSSDQGLNLGGWNLDDLCVVAIGAKAGSLCGNGVVDPGEACDDGNNLDNDGCSATCGIEITDPVAPTDNGGCCSTGSRPTGALALGAAVLGLVLRRRRRR